MNPPNGPTDHAGPSANSPQRRALAALAAQYRVPAFDLEVAHFPLEPLEFVDRSYCEEHTCLPVQVNDGLLFLAMADPTQDEVLDELATRTGRRVFAFVCDPEALRRAIDEAYGGLIVGKSHYAGPRATQGATTAMTSNAVIAPPMSFGPPPKPRSQAAASPRASEPLASAAPASSSALQLFEELLTEDDLEEYTEPAIDAPALARAVVAADAARAPDAPRAEAPAPAAPPRPPPFTPRAPSQEPARPAASEPAQAMAPSAATTTSAPVALPATTLRGQGRTVLVADDDASARLAVRDVLEPLGFRVVEADSGAATLALVEAAAIDLLVLEGELPGIHGFEVCRRITRNPLLSQIPVLLVARSPRGWRFAADARASFGAADLLAKPLRPDEVLATVERVLNGAERAAPPEETLTPATERVLAAALQSARAGDLEAASAELERGLEREPDAFRLHYTHGLIAGRRGDTFRAMRSLERALALQPQSFVALKSLAALYEREGFRRTSIELWEQAREHAPDEHTRAELEGHLMALLLGGAG